MEWYLEKFLTYAPMLALGFWTVFVYRQNRADKKSETAIGRSADETKAYLADAAEFREDIQNALVKRDERILFLENRWLAAIAQINELRDAQNDLKTQIAEKNHQVATVLAENKRLEDIISAKDKEATDLRQRVSELEKQVHELQEKSH